jgi:hypothetical protein
MHAGNDDSDMAVSVKLCATRNAPSEARAALRSADLNLDAEGRADIALLVSEVVTAAVIAPNASDVVLDIEEDASAVRVHIREVPRLPAATRLLVEEVAERWERYDDGLWFEIALS